MLKDMLIFDENPEYKTVDGIIYSKDSSKLLFCPAGITGHVRVLDGTKIICKNSFTSSQISEITIPDSVEMIDDAAFASSISLEHVYFSEDSKLMVVGSNAFYGCKALRQIILPDSVAHMKSKIFKNSGIKTFTYPDNAKLVIEDNLFVNCPLKDVTVPKALYEQKGIFYFLNPCLSDYSMYQFYETDDKEFTEAIVLTVKGFKPIAIPRYVKPGSNFDKFTDDINAFFSGEPPPLISGEQKSNGGLVHPQLKGFDEPKRVSDTRLLEGLLTVLLFTLFSPGYAVRFPKLSARQRPKPMPIGR